MQTSTLPKKRIAERYTDSLNALQTAEGIAAVTANVDQLIFAAETLAAASIHSLSCALSILAMEEAQKAALLLGLFYSDGPKEIQQYWNELRTHTKKHSNMGLDIASCAIVSGTIAPDDDAAIERKIKEAPDPNILEELKQALIYCDCIIDPNGLPFWSNPVDIGKQAGDVQSKKMLESAREYREHIYPYTEAELRVWKKHMAPVRSKPIKEQLQFMKRCEAELKELGLPVPPILAKLTMEDGS